MLETLHIRLSLVGSMFDFILVSVVFSSINKVPYPHDFFMHVLRLHMECMHQKKKARALKQAFTVPCLFETKLKTL